MSSTSIIEFNPDTKALSINITEEVFQYIKKQTFSTWFSPDRNFEVCIVKQHPRWKFGETFIIIKKPKVVIVGPDYSNVNSNLTYLNCWNNKETYIAAFRSLEKEIAAKNSKQKTIDEYKQSFNIKVTFNDISNTLIIEMSERLFSYCEKVQGKKFGDLRFFVNRDNQSGFRSFPNINNLTLNSRKVKVSPSSGFLNYELCLKSKDLILEGLKLLVEEYKSSQVKVLLEM